MREGSPRWHEVAPSRFDHEREGLHYVRDALPEASPYMAWSNFELIGSDGTPYEVDLVVLGPAGFHLVELKAWSGKIDGNDYYWLEHNPGRGSPIERRSPLPDVRTKAFEFKNWLQRAVGRRRLHLPYVAESLFLHGNALDVRLPDPVKARIFGRDDDTGNGLRRIMTDRLTAPPPNGKQPVGEREAKALAALIEAAGLTPRPTEIVVGDWTLEDEVLDHGTGWEDRLAHHRIDRSRTIRVRRWFSPPGATPAEVAAVQRAAKREFTAASGLEHPGIVVPFDYHSLDAGGAALLYRHDPQAQPLHTWLPGHADALDLQARVKVVRETALVVRYAHDHGLVHRQLSPASVLVTAGAAGAGIVKVKDWQIAASVTAPATGDTTRMTSVLGQPDAQAVFAAPEVAALQGPERPSADVFALGALTHFAVTGQPPASDRAALQARLLDEGGIDLAAVQDGVPELLRLAVLGATAPTVADRTATVAGFIADLDQALDELDERLGEPNPPEQVLDALLADSNDLVDGRFLIDRRLGEGGTSVALLAVVETDDGMAEVVLKVARDDAKAVRIDDEAAVLGRLEGTNLVAQLVEGPLTVGARRCLVIERAGDRTLADEIRAKGRLSLDQLERFGRDLLEAVALLETRGVWHRDIKPANLGIRTRRGDRRPHLVLFDFSLSSADVHDVEAGTVGYRDWFLGRDGRRRFDMAAELFSAAATLHEMASGELPRWADGQSDPASVPDEVTVRRDLIDPAVADGMEAFFQRALARAADQRYANPQDMAAAWEQALRPAGTDEVDLDARAAAATLETPLGEAGLSAAALSALEQYHVATVRDLLQVEPLELSRLPGAAQATKDEVVRRAKAWRRRLLAPPQPAGQRSLDAVRQRLASKAPDAVSTHRRAVRVMLGMPDEQSGTAALCWPTSQDVDGELGVDYREVSTAWRAYLDVVAGSADVAGLRADVLGLLAELGGVASARSLAARLADLRGSYLNGDERSALAQACVRLAVEADDPAAASTFAFRRTGTVVLVAGDDPDDVDADTLDERLSVAASLAPPAQDMAGARPSPPVEAIAERLRRAITGTPLEGVRDDRLRALAAEAGDVALSPRGELYPRGMPAADALVRAASSLLLPVGVLSEEVLRRRVLSRFPESVPLPRRPELDDLVRESGIGLVWNGDGYVPLSRHGPATTTHGPRPPGAETPERLERRLRASLDGAEFLALAVASRDHTQARGRLLETFGVTEVDVTALVVTGMRRIATEAGADWAAVLGADAPGAPRPDHDVVASIAREAASALESAVDQAGGPVLLTEPSVLAHYGCTDLLAPLTDFAAHRPHAVWALVPQASGTAVPTLDGSAVPLGAPSQWVWLPSTWVHQPEDRAA